MRAMVLHQPGQPLVAEERPDPTPGPGEARIRVLACAVCRTDLHLVDGELPPGGLPRIPGHEIVGCIDMLGPGAEGLRLGQRVGVAWLGHNCGMCESCCSGRENLCDQAGFTGYTRDGGYATHIVAEARHCYPLDHLAWPPERIAPLMCAGLIGWRAYKFAGPARRLGLYGFGAAAHLLIQVARAQGREVYAFTRPGDEASQAHARELGACWAGGSDEAPPQPLDAAILFAPVGSLVPTALAAVRKGGRVVCGGIHMSDIPGFPYRLLWGERQLMSVANLTRQDGHEFLALIRRIPVQADVQLYPLEDANRALDDLRAGRVRGAAVLKP